MQQPAFFTFQLFEKNLHFLLTKYPPFIVGYRHIEKSDERKEYRRGTSTESLAAAESREIDNLRECLREPGLRIHSRGPRGCSRYPCTRGRSLDAGKPEWNHEPSSLQKGDDGSFLIFF